MTYRTLVTVIRDFGQDAPTLASAAAYAAQHDAHLSVLALGIDHVQPGAYYAGMNAAAMQTGLAEAGEDARSAETSVREVMARETCSWDVSSAVAQMGAVGHFIARRAALADLVVLPKPYGASRGPEDVAITEAALFDTRTPLMILPEGQSTAPEAKRIVVAWNESSEALAAIRAALPLLVAAESVDIVIVDPPSHSPDRSDPGGMLAEMLVRHGVHADISVLAKTMPRISDVLCRHIIDKDADMLVMGAYGHSRFREAILGGATRNMLEQAAVPVLMAH